MSTQQSAPLEHSKPPTVTLSITVQAPGILTILSCRHAERTPSPSPFPSADHHAHPHCWQSQVGRSSSASSSKDNMHLTQELIKNVISNLLFNIYFLFIYFLVTGSHYVDGWNYVL